MANYKKADADQLNAGLASIADAIRDKAGTTEGLDFPDGFVGAISQLGNSGSGNLADNIHEAGRIASAGAEHMDNPNYSFRSANYLKAEGGKTISAELSGVPSLAGSYFPMQIVQYNKNKEIIVQRKDLYITILNGSATGNSNTTLTLDANTAYIRYCMYYSVDVGLDMTTLDEIEATVYYTD